MTALRTLVDWFAGGPNRYMTLTHCMNHDWFWIGLTVLLDLAVASGYVVIALHWWRDERPLAESPPKSALRNMKQIFLFCGLCGYLFIPVKMVWPAWRLYNGFLAILAYYTWRYAWGAKDLEVVYSALGRSERLAIDLEETRADAKRKSFFLSTISHDLRTPLNGLLLQAELAELSLSSADAEGAREAVAEIKNCAKTTADLLASFLDIGRLDWSDKPPAWSRVDLPALVQTVTETLGPKAEAKGLSVTRAGEAKVFVRSDKPKLERIVANLLDNAIKFTDRGGVQVRWEVRRTDVLVHVSDTGIGIAPEHREQVFDDFFQVKNPARDSAKGFGLGLSIARRLARKIGGDVSLESEPGRGSRFSVRLPNALAADGPASAVGEGPHAAQVSQAAKSVG
jgi:signal transduction histidine kinase